MLSNTLTLTWGVDPVTLTKIREGGYSSEYFGSFVTATGRTQKFMLSVKHTLPKVPGSGDSHLIRLDVEYYETDGSFMKDFSIWTVIRSSTITPTKGDVDFLNKGLQSLMTTALTDQLTQYES